MARASEAATKIAAYEELLNERLKVELQRVHDERTRSYTQFPRISRPPCRLTVMRFLQNTSLSGDSLHERIAQCLELRNNVTLLQEEQQRSLKTMINLGSDFYVQAFVYAHPFAHEHAPPGALHHARASAVCRPDTSYMYVNIGLGFHAQMTLDEASAFSTQREAALSESVEALNKRAAQLKARIKIVIGAIDELMQADSAGSST